MLHRINIFQSLYERLPLPKGLPPILVGGSPLPDHEDSNDLGRGRESFSLRLVPDYFQLGNLPPGYDLKSVPQDNWGHSIDLNEVSSVDQYMESQFKSKPRSIIKRYIKRLELCFPISYKYHYGEMDYKDYEKIFDALHKMISDRFVQRKESHMEVWRWDELKKDTYGLICSKQASFFVIYDVDLPIEISLNYHLNKVLFSTISSFDIDYGKFGLGHVEIYKQLEWCLKHGYTRFEMGVGGMEYKRRWSNNIYRFEHWILISKKNMGTRLLGRAAYGKALLKEYLKSKRLNDALDALREKIFRQKSLGPGADHGQLVPRALAAPVEISQWAELDNRELRGEPGLNKALNDFLYSQVVPREKVRVYRSVDGPVRYLLQGEGKGTATLLENG